MSQNIKEETRRLEKPRSLRRQLKNVRLLAASLSFRADLNKRETPPKRISLPPPPLPRQCRSQNGPFPSCDLWSEAVEREQRGRGPKGPRTESTSVLSDVRSIIMKGKAIAEVPPAAISSSVLHPGLQKKWPRMAMLCREDQKIYKNNKGVMLLT